MREFTPVYDDQGLEQPQMGHLAQLLIFIGLLVIFFVVGSLIAILVTMGAYHIPLMQVKDVITKAPGPARLVQGLSALLSFALPTFVFARILTRHPLRYLKFSYVISWKQVALVILMGLAVLFVSSALTELTNHIPLTAGLKKQFQDMEKTYEQAVESLAVMKTPLDYILSMIVIAFLPALTEEMLFRGGLQQIFTGWIRAPWIGILLTSIIFSAIHISFYGFLPRLLLGLMLGYLFYYGRNIWLNILAHFFNNGLVVTVMYVQGLKGAKASESMKFDEHMPWWPGIPALLAVIWLFILFRKESRRIHPDPIPALEPVQPFEQGSPYTDSVDKTHLY